MKLIKLTLVILFSLTLVIFVGLFIFLKTLDINRFKDQITRQISKSINRDATIKNISFTPSLSEGVTIQVSGLAISDHPDFSSDPLFYIDSAHLNIDALPLILRRQIFISKIEFDSPNISIIRNNSGLLNIEKFTEQVNDKEVVGQGASNSGTDNSTVTEPANEKTEFAFGDLLIRSIRINDGTVIYTDHATEPPMIIPISRLGLEISNLSFDTNVPFHASASMWSKRENISVNGLLRINARNKQARIDDLKIQTDLSDLSLAAITQHIPSFSELGLNDKIHGQFVINVDQMVLGEEGLLVLSSEGKLTDGKMQFSDFPIPIEGFGVHFEISESDLDVKKIQLPFAGGELSSSGRIIEYLDKQKYVGNLSIDDIQLSELAKQIELPATLDGLIKGDLKVNGEGMSNTAFKTTLAGKGALEVIDGKVVDVNLFRLVLSKLSFVPNLVERIERNLPDKYKEVLDRKDTILGKVNVNTRISNGAIMIDRAELNAEGFLVTAHGKCSFDQDLELSANFYIASDLSASMVAASEELNYLLDERQQIHIPFKPYSGKIENFMMYPDVGDISTQIIRNRGREELKKVIFGAMGRDEEPAVESTEEPTAGQETAPVEREASPEEVIIENILDMIPIFE